VSIIPTSVSYSTFKKIAFSTASYMNQKSNSTLQTINKPAEEFTKPMFAQTSTVTPFTKPIDNETSKSVFTATTSPITNVSKPTARTLAAARRPSTTKPLSVNNITNSMPSTSAVTPKLKYSNTLTTTTVLSTNITSNSHRRNIVTEKAVLKLNTTTFMRTTLFTTEPTNKITPTTQFEEASSIVTMAKPTKAIELNEGETSNKNLTIIKYNVTNVGDPNNMVSTSKPAEDEEKFHILTEPEHITAVMSEKETERSSVDLISVLSIAGGVMMAVITVAIVIVMMERCRRPRYEDVRKMNDIRMQVMIDNNDIPPPYVRSIFHTPLPGK
jgi:hypothetical protein